MKVYSKITAYTKNRRLLKIIPLRNQQRQHMKRDRISNEPRKSNSPLDQVTGRNISHPAETRSRTWRNPRHFYPPFSYSQPGPPVAIRRAPRPVGSSWQAKPRQGATTQGLIGHAATRQEVSGELQQMRRDDTWGSA